MYNYLISTMKTLHIPTYIDRYHIIYCKEHKQQAHGAHNSPVQQYLLMNN